MRLVLVLVLLGSCSQNDKSPPVQQRVVEESPEPKGVSQRLFADARATTPLSISIETLGGISTVIIPRGTKLPTSHTEVFSTAQDNQTSVEVHVLQGERAMATDNRTLGKFQLTGIPPAPRAIPQIEVKFAISEDGILEVSARDQATNKKREIRIQGKSESLDQGAIDKLLDDALAHKDEDTRRLAWSEMRMKLDMSVYELRRQYAMIGSKLSPKTAQRFRDELARADVVLASTTPGDPAVLEKAFLEVQRTMGAGAEELYAK
jgi:molecular chaperone DnaK